MRPSKRQFDEMRAISFERGVSKHAEGSCLVKFGDTHVLCTASLEEKVPGWMRNSGKGGIVEIQGTAEGVPFSEDEFSALMGLAKKGISRLVSLQQMAVA